MATTKILQYHTSIFQNREIPPKGQEPHGDVRQDKSGLPSARVASYQPDRIADELRSEVSRGISDRLQNGNAPLEPLQFWVKPIVKAETQRLAKRAGVSVSCFGAHLYERAMQNHIDMQYGALLKPIIEKTIRKELRRIGNLLYQNSLDALITKQATFYILEHLLGAQNRGTLEELLGIFTARAKAEMNNRRENLPPDTQPSEVREREERGEEDVQE